MYMKCAMVIDDNKCTDNYTSSDGTMQFYLIACELCVSSGHPQPFSQIDTPEQFPLNMKYLPINITYFGLTNILYAPLNSD